MPVTSTQILSAQNLPYLPLGPPARRKRGSQPLWLWWVKMPKRVYEGTSRSFHRCFNMKLSPDQLLVKCPQCSTWPMAVAPNEGWPSMERVTFRCAPGAMRTPSIRSAWPVGSFRLQKAVLGIRQ
jgi:hypothetical protein